MKNETGLRPVLRRLIAGILICVGAITASYSANVTYTYDAHGRLASVTRDGTLYATYAYDAAGNRISISAPLQVSLNKTFWNWYKAGSNPPSIASPVIATASGGASGYSYLWERVSGDTQTNATAPTSNSTQWTRATTTLGVPHVSTWRCRVTDSASTVIYSVNVTVEFLRETNN